MNPVAAESIQAQVRAALAEDIGTGDVTAGIIPPDQATEAVVIAREEAIVCGQDWFEAVFQELDPAVRIAWSKTDGERVEPDGMICRLQGNSRALLTGERTALNFLQTLSATATLAHTYAKSLEGLDTRVLDTRKTLPGLRDAQKYATACGGCMNHRIGLYDAILIKENHIAAAGSIANAVRELRAAHPDLKLEVEVESLDELDQALQAGSDIVLLDNFDLDMMREAVSRTDGRAKLEASGNMTLQTLRDVAETGVDYISVGGLTKDVRAIDLSMRFVEKDA